MLGKIAAFEFRYQLRQPAFWVITLLFTLIAFGVVALSSNIKLSTGANVHVNSPSNISMLLAVLNQFYMLAVAAVVANVVVRDYATGFGALIFSTPVSKGAYLFGRFLGAFGALVLTLLIALSGHYVGVLMPNVDPETLGPARFGDYLWAFGMIGLPGLFVLSALFFTLATATRSMMATYVAVVAVFILYLISTTLISQKPELERLMAWVEPLGIGAYGLATKYWTAAELNTANPPIEGVLLYSRLMWVGVGAALLAASYLVFNRSARGASETRKDRQRGAEAAQVVQARPLSVSLPRPTYGLKAAWTQLVSLTAFEMSLVFKSIAYLVLILLALGFSVLTLMLSGEIYGAPVLPVTRIMITQLIGGFVVISLIIAIYYSGELVWRDRDRRMHEIVDATPTADWTFLIPKTLALGLVLISTLLIGMLAGVVLQTIKGVTDYEIGKYLWWYVIPQGIAFLQLAVLAILVQALSPNKFVGWAVMVVYMISRIVLSNLGFDHVLYNYGSDIDSPMPLSDMNGRGDFAGFAAWTTGYWSAFAVILMVATYGLWRRGTETRFWPRLKRLPHRLAGPAGVIGGLALVAFAALGVWLFINTNVWNHYETQKQGERRLAAMEKALLRYETQPQPAVANVRLNIDLHPHAPRMTTRGSYVLLNRTDAPLNEVHFRWSHDLELTRLDVQGARVARQWPEFDYRIYRFDTPMQPGERRAVSFETVFAQKGFKVSGNTRRVVDNGTFITNYEFAPMVGMTRMDLLSDRGKRRKLGLPAELRAAKLEDRSATARNYLHGDWVTADITVTTDADQTPLAPGDKVSDTTRAGRRTARFVTETPVLNFFSVQSARYEETSRVHNGVDLVVFHDPAHGRNAPRMLDALAASLD
jgi:ABC-type transport system involved in multi-copper enzyme maturation permease subunit